MAVDAQGQIFLLDYDGLRILKATPAGDVSLAIWLPIGNPIAMTLDAQGNFIVIDGWQQAIFRVSPDGLTKLIAYLPLRQLCPDATGASIAVDKDSDYIVSASCPTGQLMKVTPSGEVTVIFDYDPQIDAKETVLKVVVDPTGQGYYVTGNTKVYHISPIGEVKTIAKGLPNNSRGNLVGLTTGPSGDLFVVSNLGAMIYQISPDGSQIKVLSQGAPLANPQGILWVPK